MPRGEESSARSERSTSEIALKQKVDDFFYHEDGAQRWGQQPRRESRGASPKAQSEQRLSHEGLLEQRRYNGRENG